MLPGKTYTCVCSVYKRIVEPQRSWRGIQYAYREIQQWMKEGTDPEKKMKLYLLRNMVLPRGCNGMAPADVQDLQIQFAYHYINALLKYASDDLKKGMSVRVNLNPNPNPC